MSIEMHKALVISWCEGESRARHVNFMKYCHFFPFRFGHCLNWNHKTHLKIALQVKKKINGKSTEVGFVLQPSLFKQSLLTAELWGSAVNPTKVPCTADIRALIRHFLSPSKAGNIPIPPGQRYTSCPEEGKIVLHSAFCFKLCKQHLKQL